jgi:hypothetical protein
MEARTAGQLHNRRVGPFRPSGVLFDSRTCKQATMSWISEHSGQLAIIGGSLTVLLLVLCWEHNVSPIRLIAKAPSALRLMASCIFLLAVAQTILWAPGLATMVLGEKVFGDWGILFVWPGLGIGAFLLSRLMKPLLGVGRWISGVSNES